jgi:predicted transcriptional regulator
MNILSGLNLGDLELAVLECIWRLGDADVKAVHAEIGTARGLSSNTVQSTLDRLYRKQLLARRKVSHAFVYSAAVDRAGVLEHTINAAISRLNGGETGAILTAFVDFAARTDAAMLLELERLVAERISAAKQGGGRGREGSQETGAC